MDKFIEIYDDIIPKNLINEVENIIIKKDIISWYYKNNISGVDNSNYVGFSHGLYNIAKKTIDYEFSSFFLQILYRLSFHLNLNIKTILQSRLFLQTPTLISKPMLEGIHTDIPFPHWVCLYYITDSDGDTIFFNDNEEEIKRVSPKKGRIVFFDGTLKHCASIPSKSSRIVLNTNFIGERFDN